MVKDYQKFTKTTALYSESINNTKEEDKNNCLRLSYVLLGLSGEVGEIQNKAKKVIRDKNGEISKEFKDDMIKEIGDVMWYVSQLCNELDLNMEEVMMKNIFKLSKRKEEGKIKGDGDNR
jgi:NTP pyrophosphatase (non-canonical NTP hydrolase)